MNFYRIKSARLNFNFKTLVAALYTVIFKMLKSRNSMNKIYSIGCGCDSILFKFVKSAKSAKSLVSGSIGGLSKAFWVESSLYSGSGLIGLLEKHYGGTRSCTRSWTVQRTVPHTVSLLTSIHLLVKSFLLSVGSGIVCTLAYTARFITGWIGSISCFWEKSINSLIYTQSSINCRVSLHYRSVYQKLLSWNLNQGSHTISCLSGERS